MALTQCDIGIRHPYPTIGGDTSYYWTQVYYVDSDDFFDFIAIRNVVRSAARRSLTAYCNTQMIQFKQPPGRGNVVETLPTFFTQGVIIPDDDYAILVQVGMVDFFDGSGNRFRKYYRQPLRRVDVDGEMISDVGIANITAYADYVLGQGVFRTLHGGLLDRYSISPRIHKWQLRHGTERSERMLLGE